MEIFVLKILMGAYGLSRLSGLVIDIFGDLAVIASSAAWVEKYKQEIEGCTRKIYGINHITWRPSVEILKEEGLDLSELKDMQASTCPERTKVCISAKYAVKYMSMIHCRSN